MRQFFSFAFIGAFGFLVDAGVLYLALYGLGFGFYSGRLLSFLAAASFTWACNRLFTFKAADKQGAHKQWARFVAVNSIGGLVNYGTYAALIATLPLVQAHPILGVGAGSIAGLAFNFTLSKKLVFKA